MRWPSRVLAILLCAASGPPAAGAQQAPRRRALPDPAPPVQSRGPDPGRVASVSPPPRLTLEGLPRTGDPAPACRSRCALVRGACEAGGGEHCASAWATCVPSCTPAR